MSGTIYDSFEYVTMEGRNHRDSSEFELKHFKHYSKCMLNAHCYLSVYYIVHMLTSDLSIKRGKKYHFYNYIDMLRQTDALPNTAPAPASVLLQ